MKRFVFIIFLVLFAIGCSSNKIHTSKLSINGKDSGIPNVYFHENYVTLPCISTLQSLGGEYYGQADQSEINILLQGKVFRYDIEKQQLSVRENMKESIEGEGAEERILLPSPEIKDSAIVYWEAAEIIADQSTLQKVLNSAGIEATIEVDYQKELISIKVPF